jgi:hypothetical protein
MTNRDELRQAVAQAIAETAWDINPWPSLADAAIAAYEAHRPRADVALTRGEWDVIAARISSAAHEPQSTQLSWLECEILAASPWLQLEGE